MRNKNWMSDAHRLQQQQQQLGRSGRIRGGGGMTSLPPPRPASQVCDCKRRHRKVPSRDGRIFNGSAAAGGDFPWQVRIEQFNYLQKGTWDHICGGTLISAHHVLTASHCLQKDVDKYQIVVGSHDRRKRGRRYRVKDYVQHRASILEYENDIALITLDSESGGGVACDEQVQPICLDGPDFRAGQYCFISGWGETEKERQSEHLRYAAVPLLPFDICQELFKFKSSQQFTEPGSNYLRSYSPRVWSRLSEKMLCAGPIRGGADTCAGDSGGPLACFDHNNVAYLTGIASWSANRCGEQPSAYTKVSKYKNWIKEEQGLSPSRGIPMRDYYHSR